jgi:hypothetical protein
MQRIYFSEKIKEGEVRKHEEVRGACPLSGGGAYEGYPHFLPPKPDLDIMLPPMHDCTCAHIHMCVREQVQV